MEIEIGKHCNECNQLDYLPFLCNNCKKFFCVEHRKNHICIPSKKPKKLKKTTRIINEPCFFNKCKKSKIQRCKLCGKDYCIDHRHQEVHNCEKKCEKKCEKIKEEEKKKKDLEKENYKCNCIIS